MKNSRIIDTGLTAVDDILGGFMPGNLYAIAARPGMGVTSFIHGISANVLEHTDAPVLYCAGEFSQHFFGFSGGRYRSYCLQDAEKVSFLIEEIADGGIVFIDNFYGDVSHILTKLKKIAREKDCPIVVGFKLPRKLERRKDRRPRLTDFGDIADLFDGILLLYREMYYACPEGGDAEDESVCIITIAKNPLGGVGTAMAPFCSDYFAPTYQ